MVVARDARDFHPSPQNKDILMGDDEGDVAGAIHYWTAPGPAIMQHAVMDSATMFSEKLHDSRRNLRWLAWERKNRRGDRITEKRMKLVFAAVGLILLIWIAYALSQVSEPRGRVEKGPTVAFLRTIGPLRYCVETAKVSSQFRRRSGQEC